MPGPMLHYVHDPLCGWCYAAAPMVDAVRKAGIPLSLHGGGLWADPTGLSADKAAYIRKSDARIASLSGQPTSPPASGSTPTLSNGRSTSPPLAATSQAPASSWTGSAWAASPASCSSAGRS